MSGRYNFTINQGESFTRVLTWKDSADNPIDLSGYTARMDVRENVNSSSELLQLTTGNSRIALGGSAGTITLSLTDSETAAITWDKGVYDLELISGGGVVTRLMQGEVSIDKEVTR